MGYLSGNAAWRPRHKIYLTVKPSPRVVAYLNAILHNRYTRQPEKLRAWKSASHIERAPRHAPAPESTPAPPVAPADPAG